MIYLDYNATTPLLPEVTKLLNDFDSENLPLNPSSIHQLGRKAKFIIETARASILASLHCSSDYKLIFTSSATEANNQVMKSFAEDQVVADNASHASVLECGGNFIKLPVCGNGLITQEALIAAISNLKAGFLVSICWANNETGIVQNAKEICETVKQYGGFTHLDAVQMVGKIAINLAQINADYVTISSHKIGGCTGAAAVIYRSTAPIKTLLNGGGQELGLRCGTENVRSIFSFGHACNIATLNIQNYYSYTKELQQAFESNLLSKNISIIGYQLAEKNRLPNTTMFIHPNLTSSTALMQFDMAGIMVSNGSACSSGKITTSKTLLAMGIEQNTASRAIRVSFGQKSCASDHLALSQLLK
jgi:cysteine desulfurase